jgi:peptide/nickel transport system substrate-binding protein
MENRFGIKDFFIVLLLMIVIVMIALAMKQYDRQYQLLVSIERGNRDQLSELVAIHDDLRHGMFSVAATNPSAAADNSTDPFAALRKLRDEGKYDQGDWLVENFGAPVGKISPFLSTDEYGAIIQARVQESLIFRDPDTLKFMPLLASGWTITNNVKNWQAYVDGRKASGEDYEKIIDEPDCPAAETIDFPLRHEVTFSDGTPFNADDVIFTYQFIENPAIDAPRDREALNGIKTIRKINDYEVAVDFKQPYFGGFEAIGEEGILSKKFYSQFAPEKYNNSTGLLLGTGPYRMADPTSWEPGPGKIELLRNERYWGLAPSFNRLVYYQVQSDAASLVMYGNGELDLLALTPQQYELQLKNPTVMDRSNSNIYSSPLVGYFFIAWNEVKGGKSTIFSDKRIRQAMTLLTDRKGLCDTIYLGYADPSMGPFYPTSPQHDPNLVDWSYDPPKALEILKEAGYEDRGKGVLEKADGTQLSFKFTYPSGNETTDRMMKYIKDDYARVGIAVELDPVDWTIMDERMTKSHDFDALTMGWMGGAMEQDIYQMFDSSQIADQADNFMSYSSPEFDQTVRAARRELDDAKRMQLWHKCEAILHEDQPYTFLLVPKIIRLSDKRIKNMNLAPTGSNFVQDWVLPIPWYVPADEQKYKQ